MDTVQIESGVVYYVTFNTKVTYVVELNGVRMKKSLPIGVEVPINGYTCSRAEKLSELWLTSGDKIRLKTEFIDSIVKRDYGDDLDDNIDFPEGQREMTRIINRQNRKDTKGKPDEEKVHSEMSEAELVGEVYDTDFARVLETLADLPAYWKNLDDDEIRKRINKVNMKRRKSQHSAVINLLIKKHLRSYDPTQATLVEQFIRQRIAQLGSAGKKMYELFITAGGMHYIDPNIVSPTIKDVIPIPFWERRSILPEDYYSKQGVHLRRLKVDQLVPYTEFVPIAEIEEEKRLEDEIEALQSGEIEIEFEFVNPPSVQAEPQEEIEITFEYVK